jgi:hypothetical protein
MLRGVITWIMGASAGCIILAAMMLSGSPVQAAEQYHQAIQGVVFVQAATDHHDDGEPCRDDGASPGPGCCAVVHCIVAAVLPSTEGNQRPQPAGPASYPTAAAPSAHGFLAVPVLPPPRAVT